MNPHANNELFQFADSFDTLADIALINDRNLSDVEGISDLLDDAPVLQLLAATTASNGTTHKYEKEVTAPTIGMRSGNEGIEHSKSGDEIVSIDLKFIDPHTRIDSAVARTYTKRPGGVEGYLARKNRRHLKAGFASLEDQIFYGSSAQGVTGGFAGLAQALNDLSMETVVDGGGSDNLSSVYFIRTNDDHMDCSAVFGEDGNITIGTPQIQEVTLADGKHQMAYVTEIGAWAGLQIGSKWSVVRLANVENLTDNLLSLALEVMPKPPTFIAMTRKKRGTLQRSRTTYSPIGAPAPIPQEYEGIPIITTDRLRNDETAVADI